MICVAKRGTHRPLVQHQRGAPHLTQQRLSGYGFHVRDTSVALEPIGPRGIQWGISIAAKWMVIERVVILHPIDILNRLFKGGISDAHKIPFIYPDYC